MPYPSFRPSAQLLATIFLNTNLSPGGISKAVILAGAAHFCLAGVLGRIYTITCESHFVYIDQVFHIQHVLCIEGTEGIQYGFQRNDIIGFQ